MSPVLLSGKISYISSTESGVIVFNVISGKLSKKGRIEVLTDDGYWPCFTTPKARSTTAEWDYVGEGFLKEIDFAQVWLRLDQAEDEDKDDIAAEFREDAKQFLRSALVRIASNVQGLCSFCFRGDPISACSRTRMVTLAAPFWLSVATSLFPSNSNLGKPSTVSFTQHGKLECTNQHPDQGVLHVELIEGHDLRAADRSGKSDPFVEFNLNGSRVYKSDAKKKTLNPQWDDESFDVEIVSNYRS